MLGRLYFTQGQFTKASQTFAKANALEPNSIKYQEQYLQALFFANKQIISEKQQQLINKLLQRQADNSMILNLLAMDAYHKKQFQQAIELWQKILPQFPANSANAKALRETIATVKQKLS